MEKEEAWALEEDVEEEIRERRVKKRKPLRSVNTLYRKTFGPKSGKEEK